MKFDDTCDDDKDIDDSFFDIEEEDTTLPDMAEDITTFSAAVEDESEEDEEEEEEEERKWLQDEALDSRGIPGWDSIDQLATALLALSGLSVTTSQAEKIKKLYDNLLDYDKKSLIYDKRKSRPSWGRFARTKRSGHVSAETVRR